MLIVASLGVCSFAGCPYPVYTVWTSYFIGCAGVNSSHPASHMLNRPFHRVSSTRILRAAIEWISGLSRSLSYPGSIVDPEGFLCVCVGWRLRKPSVGLSPSSRQLQLVLQCPCLCPVHVAHVHGFCIPTLAVSVCIMFDGGQC